MTRDELEEQLCNLIDEHTLNIVLDALSSVCFAKVDYEFAQSPAEQQRWLKVGNQLATLSSIIPEDI